jgi:hypothetical protein
MHANAIHKQFLQAKRSCLACRACDVSADPVWVAAFKASRGAMHPSLLYLAPI